MKKFIVSLLFVLSGFISPLKAQHGDTIEVQTFTFGSPQDAWFVFPSDTIRFEKILMLYTLKCNPAMSPACGEWDYLTYTYLYDHTGLLDSSVVHQPTYTVNGASPSSLAYMTAPSYSYFPTWQYSIVHTDTTSLNTYAVGNTLGSIAHPFSTQQLTGRSQYLWKASEMSAAGILPGNITGLQFYLQSLGSGLGNLTIRIKPTTLDSLDQNNLQQTGFTTVYSQNTNFLSTGWNSLQLTNAFNWNGTTNLIIEISFEQASAGTNSVVAGDSTSFTSGLYNTGNDRYLAFHSNGYVSVPMNDSLTTIDSAITISYWAYGTPAYQPMDGTCFEAVDSAGNRILNAHMPWSDSNVYWDAGQNSGYDRINKAATTSEIEGQWNYWTFTKNVATGSMKIYLNGALWHSGTGKVKPMNNIHQFRIGKGNWGGSQTYEGNIDEFAVYNTELSASVILANMNKTIDATHPNYTNLVLYYQSNDGNYLTIADSAASTNTPATLMNGVDNQVKKPTDLVFGFTETSVRPSLKFEQGVFTSYMDSTLVVDSVMNTPQMVLLYTDSINNPGVAIDTMTVWPAYYNHYVYDANGNPIDSVLVTPTDTLNLAYYDWYTKFPQVLRYELGRYITPYGIGLSLGTGWTWTFDVTDYRTLLADSVHLAAGNWQELLDLKFVMIKGIPPRDVISISNLWNGGFNYGIPTDPIDNYLTSKTIDLPSSALSSKWKSRITGHGMDTPENCAEFCPKYHYFKINGVQQYSQLVWRDNCDRNPLFPQGGTWVYDRSNWCPGAEVWTYDFELTPFVTPGTTNTLDHDVQAYSHTGGWDYYQIEDQLVTYGAPNFTTDAAIVDILSPSADKMWLRYNPICTNPVVRIKNTGSDTLTSLTFTYGLDGAVPSVFTWTGSLPFDKTLDVTLDNFNWANGATKFTVTISNPNGATDQYSFNNTKTTPYTYAPVFPETFVIELKTNHYGWENSYNLKDASGTIVFSRSALVNDSIYRDTLTLPDGCYEFELIDTGEDGLNFWANPDAGGGLFRFRKADSPGVVKSYNADFGGQIYQQFTVGLQNSTNEYYISQVNSMGVYPNPTEGSIYVNIDLKTKQDVFLQITNAHGQKILVKELKNVISETVEMNLKNYGTGMYFVTLQTEEGMISKRVMVK